MNDRELPRGISAPPSGPVIVHFDGAAEVLEGRTVAAYGYTIDGVGFRQEDHGLAVSPGHPRATNNVAEYVGAICALEWLARNGYTGDVRVLGDSQLVIRQMTGEYRVLAEHLKPYHDRLAQLCRSFHRVEFVWVPRSENERADALSKRGVGLTVVQRKATANGSSGTGPPSDRSGSGSPDA